MQGITVLFSSGDNGVAGSSNVCLNENGTLSDSGKRFNPGFPPSCQYVTAIGATQILADATINDPETACEKVIYSGGGFSNYFEMPDYQTKVVKKYLADSAPALGYNSTQFNNSGNSRGFPDISSNGAKYVIFVEGVSTITYGTSASAPVIGAIFTLINGERMDAGKGPIGFVNPTLYSHPEMFNDITVGGNQGCGTKGFESVPGWDPVTGMGTPIYPKMRDVFMNLPSGYGY